MSIFTNNLYMVFVFLGVGVLISGYYLLKRFRVIKGNKNITTIKADKTANEEKEKPLDPTKTISVSVLDDTGMPPRLRYRELPYQVVLGAVKLSGKTDRVWSRNNKRLYALHKTAENVYEMLPQPSGRSRSPRRLFDDMQLPEIEVVYDMRQESNFFGKWGWILVWSAVMAFIMFLWMNGGQ